MNKIKICIVTGGLGFIGTHLLQEIEDRYAKIIVVDSLSPNIHAKSPKITISNIDLIVGGVEDLRTWELVADHLPDEDFVLDVFHLAADTSTGNSIKVPSAHVVSNVVGTSRLCEFLAEYANFIGFIKLTSTRAIYGEGLWESVQGELVSPAQRTKLELDRQVWNPLHNEIMCVRPVPVSASLIAPNPVNVYGSTKLGQEQLLTIWCSYYGIPLFVYRLQNVYGPGQSLWNSYSGIVSLFVRKAILGEMIEVYEGGGIIRDFVYVMDVVNVLCEEISPVSTFQIFDVGTGESNTLLKVAETISEIGGNGKVTISNKYRFGDVRGIYADTTSIQTLQSFREFRKIRYGLEKLIEWAEPEIRGANT